MKQSYFVPITGETITADDNEMMTVDEIKRRAAEARKQADEKRAEEITASKKPVYLFYSGPYIIEILTKPEADGLHKYQVIRCGGGKIEHEGHADIMSLAAMLRTGDVKLQVMKEESSRRAAAYAEEYSRKVGDICDAAEDLINLYNGGLITATELKNEINDIIKV